MRIAPIQLSYLILGQHVEDANDGFGRAGFGRLGVERDVCVCVCVCVRAHIPYGKVLT